MLKASSTDIEQSLKVLKTLSFSGKSLFEKFDDMSEMEEVGDTVIKGNFNKLVAGDGMFSSAGKWSLTPGVCATLHCVCKYNRLLKCDIIIAT